MKYIVKCCDDAKKGTGTLTNSTGAPLKQNMKKEEWRNIEEFIRLNEKTTKLLLKQQKLKKFNYLKYKPAN